MTRMKSLTRDENDLNHLKYGKFANMGSVVSSEYYQPCPFFFNREGTTIPLVGTYRGATAFLIASGPSFKDLNKDLLKQPGIWTMTINNAVASFRGNASITVDDPARFNTSLWTDPSIQKFVPSSHFEKPIWDNRYLDKEGQQWKPAEIVLGDCPNVIGYRRNEKFVAERFLYEDSCNWGNHKKWGGGRSVMLAALRILFLLGFRKVYLLGVDFYMSDNRKYHFDEERTPNAIRGNMSTYEKMIKWFEELQPYFLAEHYIVKNCNPESRLTAFPFITFQDAIADATQIVGDTSKEKTIGMYTTYEEKMAVLNADKKKLANIIVPNQPNPQRIISTSPIMQPPVTTPSQPSEKTFIVDRTMRPIAVTDVKTGETKPITTADIKM